MKAASETPEAAEAAEAAEGKLGSTECIRRQLAALVK